jgi:hypothetical protein
VGRRSSRNCSPCRGRGLPSEEERPSLLARVRSFAEDVAGYERLVAGDLARARADLELARRAALRLLVGEEGTA